MDFIKVAKDEAPLLAVLAVLIIILFLAFYERKAATFAGIVTAMGSVAKTALGMP